MTFTRLNPRALLRSTCLALAASVLVFGAAPLHAKEDKRDKHLDRMVSRMDKELDLTDEQAAKIRAILAQSAAGMPHRGAWKADGKGCEGCARCAEGHGSGAVGEAGFAAQMRAGTVDTAALNRAFAARADSMQARLRARHAARVATFAEIHAVLTPAQRAKAADKMDKRAAETDKKWKKKCEKKCGKDCR